tara:strand:- start:1855 stop:2271 length:417 start_codon:yes stop_codon:yes gene_type:complete
MSKFKVGDVIERNSGENVLDSQASLTVRLVDGSGDYWFDEITGSLSKHYQYMYKLVDTAYPNLPKKHAELIKAWADGADIEYESKCNSANWFPTARPSWNDSDTYRIALPKQTANEVEKESILTELAVLQKRLDNLEV